MHLSANFRRGIYLNMLCCPACLVKQSLYPEQSPIGVCHVQQRLLLPAFVRETYTCYTVFIVYLTVLVACSGEVLLANGQVVPCALKKLSYQRFSDKERANAELAAFRDAQGSPHLAQCYGAYEQFCPEEQKQCLWIVME